MNPAAGRLLADGNLSGPDLATLGQLLDRREIGKADVVAIATRFSDALEGGLGDDLRGLLDRVQDRSPIQPPLRNIDDVSRRVAGGRPLSKDDRVLVQRALIALANRLDQPTFMLPKYGADGDFGGETRAALTAFQAHFDLPENGELTAQTAARLNQELSASAPPPFVDPGSLLPGPKSMVAAGEWMVRNHAEHYGVDDPWYSIDPNYALGTGRFGGLRGQWKCNLFACQTVFKGGFEPPYYGNRGKGEYPIANELYRWSDKYAGQYGNKKHFELVGELNVNDAPAESRRRLIGLTLSKAEAGDLIIVDHQGDDGADGGHCRVVLDAAEWKNGQGHISCAQASRNAAETQAERIHEFTGEERIWVLRPNRPQRA